MDYYEVQSYAAGCSSVEPKLLEQLHKETYERVALPNMISGRVQGRFLAMVSSMMNPNKILEIGTFTGYSGLCLAEGLGDGGLLYTIDRNAKAQEIALRYFNMAGVRDKVVVYSGDALDIISGMDVSVQFDLVFIDADKKNYLKYYDAVMPLVRAGGLIIADNVLWGGRVMGGEVSDSRTRGILEFTERVKGDDRVGVVFLPLRDGLLLINKK